MAIALARLERMSPKVDGHSNEGIPKQSCEQQLSREEHTGILSATQHQLSGIRVNTHVKVTDTSDPSYKHRSAGFLFFKQAIANPTSKTVCVIRSRE